MASRASPARVVILLATYDGAAFLAEQLASLEAQDHADWRLVWRDDGSRDDSVAIMQSFAASQAQGRVERLGMPEEHVGSAAGFLALLRHVAPTLGPRDVVAFADQDDVWLPFKLSRAVRALGAADAEAPAIYSARQVLVDARLNPLAVSPRLTAPPRFPASLTQNVATGCTMAMNAAAARLVAGSRAPGACQHDWWAYLLVTAAGGIFLADEEPVVLYRQHGRNAVGAPRTFLLRGWAALRRGPRVFMGLLRQNVAALDAQRHLLTPEARAQLDLIEQALRGGPLRRLAVLRQAGLRRQGRAEQMLFQLWFMFG
jgi:glycosyltransferase involved in cell wall biosynthesis